tara:strand:+ start:131 stop:1108 length:978 start_codon:yes stop_codon:yes gene_type:complete
MKKNLIISKTPLRVSFFGGGTDIEYYSKLYEGKVLSTSINKYIYVVVRKHGSLYKTNFRLNYSISENQNSLSKIKNKIIRECLKFLSIKGPIYISTFSDIPDRSGLGSSSSFTVGLLNALYTYKGMKVSQKRLAEEAYFIETAKIKNPIGRQDQYAAAIGGLNYLKFTKDNKVIIKRVKNKNMFKLINNNMILVWTKIRRENRKILETQKNNFKYNKIYLDKIKSYVDLFNKEIKKKQITKKFFGNLLNLSQISKTSLNNKIINSRIANLIEKIKLDNIYGLKILGAGGGGFVLCCLENKKILSKKFECENFEMDHTGTKIIFNG